ncbi:hypothetical protein [Chryseobacterium taichungense]|uniref:hypothetical protein n=1 Tax=Chryseobacterium taichungense TaxID=295069 RepID=UPI0028AA1AE2|nr:hypothetical protein [Chryseobacterium taichungense]
MKKIIYIIFLYSSFFISQVKVDIKFIDSKNNLVKGNFLEIRIINNSDLDYILPIDTTDFSTFYSGEKCVDFSDLDNDKNLTFKVDLKNVNNSISEMSIPHYKLTGQIDNKSKLFIKEMSRRDSLIKLENKRMILWKKQNKIQQSDIWIAKNKYLISSLVFVKAKQEVKFYKYFNPKKFNLNSISGDYDYFNLILDNVYQFSLKYCIDNIAYKYLTDKQKAKFKNFKFFSGSLESNKIELKQ